MIAESAGSVEYAAASSVTLLYYSAQVFPADMCYD